MYEYGGVVVGWKGRGKRGGEEDDSRRLLRRLVGVGREIVSR